MSRFVYFDIMDNEIKIAPFYDSEKMHSSILKMEQFYTLSNDKNLDDKNRICARRLFEHYRRLAMCILMKEFPDDFRADQVVDVEYMKNQYKGYAS